jgi:sulfatase maturation enzyme AslB (radical SAM superfamily)
VVELQFAGGLIKFQALECLYATCLILLKVASDRIFTDPNTYGDLVMRESSRLEQQRFHLSLYTWVGMVIALLIQLFDVLFRKRQLQHLLRSLWFLVSLPPSLFYHKKLTLFPLLVYLLLKNPLSTTTEFQNIDIHALCLYQATPLHIQQCTSEYWLVCNPTGSGHIVVLDTSAKLLLEQFHQAHTLNEILPQMASETSEHIAAITALFYRAGLLQTHTGMTIHEKQEADTVTAWLHVTNACNLRCQYCYLGKTTEYMNEDVAFRAVDAVFRSALKRHSKQVRLKYAGGEASLHMERVIAIHDYGTQLAQQHNLSLHASILSNGVVLSARTIDNFKIRNIGVMISLDGLGSYHDSQRPFRGGQPSFKYVDRTINLLIANGLIPHISVTISQRNLDGLSDLFMYLLERQLPRDTQRDRSNRAEKWKVDDDGELLILWHTERVWR